MGESREEGTNTRTINLLLSFHRCHRRRGSLYRNRVRESANEYAKELFSVLGHTHKLRRALGRPRTRTVEPAPVSDSIGRPPTLGLGDYPRSGPAADDGTGRDGAGRDRDVITDSVLSAPLVGLDPGGPRRPPTRPKGSSAVAAGSERENTRSRDVTIPRNSSIVVRVCVRNR